MHSQSEHLRHASAPSREPSPPLFSSTTALCRGALISMMQPADLGKLDHPAEFGSVRQPGFRRVTHQ